MVWLTIQNQSQVSTNAALGTVSRRFYLRSLTRQCDVSSLAVRTIGMPFCPLGM